MPTDNSQTSNDRLEAELSRRAGFPNRGGALERRHRGRADRTLLTDDMTGGLGELVIRHPPGTFALTPASLIAIEAVGRHQRFLKGTGIDWGCGTGCLAIAAAKIPAVEFVIGLDIEPANVAIAAENAARNGVDARVSFMVADSYAAVSAADRPALDSRAGRVDFIVANPPASGGDDGFEFRRRVLQGGRRFLAPGGVVLLNVSYQYGQSRVERLVHDAPGFAYQGVVASTDWVPFDLTRPDLLRCLEDYVHEEQRGGMEYSFRNPHAADDQLMNARAALDSFQATARSPLSKWQTHLFEWRASA